MIFVHPLVQIYINSDAGVYTIQWLKWNKKYVGETSCPISKTNSWRQKDFLKDNEKNAMVQYNLETFYNAKDSNMLFYIRDKNTERLFNLVLVLITWLSCEDLFLVKWVQKSYKIPHLKCFSSIIFYPYSFQCFLGFFSITLLNIILRKLQKKLRKWRKIIERNRERYNR